MIIQENNPSAIDGAIRTLERARWLKRNSFKRIRARQHIFTGDRLASLAEIKGVLKGGGDVFRIVASALKREMKRKPWALLATVALGSFGLGLLTAKRMALRAKVRS